MEPGFRNIKDDYKILNTIGRGSFARVKRAQNRQTKELVAVKSYSKKDLKQEDLEALQLELEIIKNIDHPNITRYYTSFPNG